MREMSASGTRPARIIATGFIADNAETATEFPSVGANSSAPEFQAVYWRCIAVFLFSARLTNPEAEAMLFTNIRPPHVDGVDLEALFRRLGVTIVTLGLSHRLPPKAGVRRWGSVFYVLDVLNWLVENRPHNRFAFVDSDIVLTGSLDGLFDLLDDHAFVGHRMAYPPTHDVNGMTPALAAGITAELGGAPREETLAVYGGELLATDTGKVATYLPLVRDLWHHTLAISAGDTPITTEEHFWSIFFKLHHVSVADGNAWIKRIATYWKFNTTVPGDEHIPGWHLPAEKRLGFVDMFRFLKSQNFSTSLGRDSFRKAAMKFFGIPRQIMTKRVRDAARRAARAVAKRREAAKASAPRPSHI
jgi:hypothetical protein